MSGVGDMTPRDAGVYAAGRGEPVVAACEAGRRSMPGRREDGGFGSLGILEGFVAFSSAAGDCIVGGA